MKLYLTDGTCPYSLPRQSCQPDNWNYTSLIVWCGEKAATYCYSILKFIITTNLVPWVKNGLFDCLTRFIINSYTKRGNSKMNMQMSILKRVGLQHFFCHYMTKTYSNLRGHKKLPMYLDFIQFTTEPNSDINLCLHSTASSCCYFWEMAYLGLTDLVYGLKEMDTVVKKWLCWYTF